MWSLILLVLGLPGLSNGSFLASDQQTNFSDPCEVYGTVYLAKSQYSAEHVVYIEQEEGMASLTVFKEDSKLMADEPGVWYLTESEQFAQHRIFITNDRRIADFTVEYVDERAFAGCP